MPRVLIVQAEMKAYRVPFFTDLNATLQREGIHLTVAYSAQNSKQAAREDGAELPADFGLKVNGHWFANRFLYQPLWKEIWNSDLVIVGNENKYLINPILLLLSALRIKTVAFWGLGPNMHPDRSPLSEWIKARFVTSVDWWFAYTESIAKYLEDRGMPSRAITNVQNATDMRRLVEKIPAESVVRAREALTGNSKSMIGLYCGLLGSIKEIPLLIKTARKIRDRCADFHLVIIGTGPDRSWLEHEIISEPWIHYVGPKFGAESALYYKMADVFILAGTAGLAIVDSFAAGLPVIATKLPTHPPEISYLRSCENGILAEPNSTDLAAAVIEIISSPSILANLRNGAAAAGSKYTIEAMVENFSGGIKQCLARYGKAREFEPSQARSYSAGDADA